MSALQWPVVRHVLHPIRSVRSAMRRGRQAIAAFRTLSIRRETRHACWCSGALEPIVKRARHRANYRVCKSCGCYVNVRPPKPSELSRLYAFDLYWHGVQTRMGFPTIEERTQHDLADGRLHYWVDVVKRFAPPTGHAIEVGCAHGILLAALQKQGYRCTGVEPDAQTAEWTSAHTGVRVEVGFFPGPPLDPCDVFLAFDVIEHTPEPLAFLRAARELLRPGGVVIIQTPIERHDFADPFSDRPDFFDDLQHLYLFSEPSFTRLAKEAGLAIVAVEDAPQRLGQVAVLAVPT